VNEKRITVREKPLCIEHRPTNIDLKMRWMTIISDIAICTKDGMDIVVRDAGMIIPDTQCFFYVKLVHTWLMPDGSNDYDEIITDGSDFYITFRGLGIQKLVWTETVQQHVLEGIKIFVSQGLVFNRSIKLSLNTELTK